MSFLSCSQFFHPYTQCTWGRVGQRTYELLSLVYDLHKSETHSYENFELTLIRGNSGYDNDEGKAKKKLVHITA